MTNRDKMQAVSRSAKRRIFELLDDGEMRKALRMALRWSDLHRQLYPGDAPWTPGRMVDDWLETRRFESLL